MKGEVREEMRLLRKVGWELIGASGKDHQAIKHPQFGQTTLPSTPSDHRWRKNQRRDIAKRMGLTLRQLEIEMGVASPSRTNGHRPKRQRNVNGVEVHRLRLAGGFPDAQETPNRIPGFCEHNIELDRECADCGRSFDHLPKFCEHGRSMQQPCRRCCRTVAEPKPPAKAQPRACRYCNKTIEPTGKRGRPRVYCDKECENAARRAQVLSLIRDHAKAAT